MDLAAATASDFDPYVGSVFRLQTTAREFALTLDNVKRSDQIQPRDNELIVEGRVLPPRSPFALTFEGPQSPVLDSAIYRLEHDELGEIDLFVSPFRQDRTCVLYESTFF